MSEIVPLIIVALSGMIGAAVFSIYYLSPTAGPIRFERLVIPLLFAAILFPFLRVPVVPDFRIELLVIFPAWALLIISRMQFASSRRALLPQYKWFILFAFTILLSMFYAGAVKGQLVIGRDYWELFKIIQYLVIFSLFAELRTEDMSFRTFFLATIGIFLLSAMFGFLQFWNIGDINSTISPYYAPTQMRGLLASTTRITGTTPNPNEFGAVMVIGCSLAIAGVLKLTRRSDRYLCWGLLPVLGFALIITLSRTSVVALVASAASIMMLYIIERASFSRIIRINLIILLVVIIAAAILSQIPEKGFDRMMQLGAVAEATSWQARLSKWVWHLAVWKESVFFGWGPGKATMSTIVDNEWIYLLRRYGVVGTTILVFMIGSFLVGLQRVKRVSQDPYVAALTLGLQGTLIGFLVYMIAANIYHSLQIMPIFLMLLGIVFSRYGRSEALPR